MQETHHSTLPDAQEREDSDLRHLTSYRYVDAIAKAGSIRKAAESLAITPSALNRRVLALEEELGVPVFERLPRGVRLSAAGELLIHHIRHQLSDLARVRSQIADLAGVRRGHVSIACSQALLPYFLPEQIATYRDAHPGVTFGVHVRDRGAAEQALSDHSADIALVFEPVRSADFETVVTVRQRVQAVMSPKHPLSAESEVRLRDCLAWPIALPTAPYGIRHLLDAAVMRSSLRMLKLEPVAESDSFEFLRHHAMTGEAITFQIPIGLGSPDEAGPLVARPLDPDDVPDGLLYMGQLRGRTLPVAAARFADQLVQVLQARYA